MRLVQFIKWWWFKNDEFNRTVIPLAIFWIIPCAILGIWFGRTAFLIMISGVGAVAACWVIYAIFWLLRNLWRDFEDEVPSDDVKIVNRLKGTND